MQHDTNTSPSLDKVENAATARQPPLPWANRSNAAAGSETLKQWLARRASTPRPWAKSGGLPSTPVSAVPSRKNESGPGLHPSDEGALESIVADTRPLAGICTDRDQLRAFVVALKGGTDVPVCWQLLAEGRFTVREVPVAWRHVNQSRVSPLRDATRMAVDLVRMRLTMARRR